MGHTLFAQSAQTDLLEAWLFIAQENPAAADRVMDAILQEANTLSLQPRMGRARPELGRGIRTGPTSTPYVLFYLADKHGITVVRVLHHARDLNRATF